MMQQESDSRMPRTVLFSAFCVGFAMWAPIYCVPPMEHILTEQLFLTHTQTSLLFSVPILMLVATAIPAGIVADRIGVKKATGIGLIVMAIGAIMRGTATNYISLLAFTFIYGLGFGWIFPNLPKVISTFERRDKVNVSMGVVNSGFPIGTALGLAITVPIILPIAKTFQGVFLIWSIPTIVAASLWWISVKEPPRITNNVETSKRGVNAFRKVISNKQLWLVTSIMFLHQYYSKVWTGWTPVLMMMKGVPPSSAGLIASTSIWVMIPTVLLVPRLSYKLGVMKPFLWLPSIVLAFAAWGATWVSVSMSWYLMALAGVFLATRYATLLALPIYIMDEMEVGTATGIFLSIGYIGGVIGPLIGGSILDTTQSLDLSLVTIAVISLATAFLAWRMTEASLMSRT